MIKVTFYEPTLYSKNINEPSEVLFIIGYRGLKEDGNYLLEIDEREVLKLPLEMIKSIEHVKPTDL